MMFFYVMWFVTAAAAAANRMRRTFLPGWPAHMRIGMSAALLIAGIDHFVTPERYVPMIDGFLPYAGELVLFTGACEIAGAIGLLVPSLRRLASILLALYFLCVFPANVGNALHGLEATGLPRSEWYYWARLAFQPLAIWWALIAGEVIPLPQSRKAA